MFVLVIQSTMPVSRGTLIDRSLFVAKWQDSRKKLGRSAAMKYDNGIYLKYDNETYLKYRNLLLKCKLSKL